MYLPGLGGSNEIERPLIAEKRIVRSHFRILRDRYRGPFPPLTLPCEIYPRARLRGLFDSEANIHESHELVGGQC